MKWIQGLLVVGAAFRLLSADTAAPPTLWKWEQMDNGPFFASNLEGPHEALKTVTVKLAGGQAGVNFDTMTLRWNAAWTGGFLHLPKGRDGLEGVPRPWGETVFSTQMGPGWAHQGSLLESRKGTGRNAPLPREHAKWRGLYLHGDQTILSYTLHGTGVLELPGWIKHEDGSHTFTRTIQFEEAVENEAVRVTAPLGTNEAARNLTFGTGALQWSGPGSPWLQLKAVGGDVRWDYSDGLGAVLRIRRLAAHQPIRIEVTSLGQELAPEAMQARISSVMNPSSSVKLQDLRSLIQGGPARWGEPIRTQGKLATSGGDGPYVVDTITPPDDTPFKSWLRFAGMDFFADPTRAAICSVSGDVWVVSGLTADLADLRWQRVATGLFQPLGLKVVKEKIFVLCRDGLYRLHDLNGDGEADYYECFNNDVTITPNYHEFCLGLETDRDGNFYFNKGGNLGEASIPHHGCLLRISADGSRLDIVANGLRAPNGIGMGPNGEITSSDNEGNWVPASRVNLMRPGGFYGHVFTAHRTPKPTAYDGPLFWLPKNADNSSGGQAWVTSKRWGPYEGDLLHASYGTCSLFKAFYETVDGVEQGGCVRFPLKFDSGIMRSRFSPGDGQLYTCGLVVWQSNGARQGAFHRVRYTGKPVVGLRELKVKPDGVELQFTAPLERGAASDVQNYGVERWNYKWLEKYGSPEYSVLDPEKKAHDPVDVKEARLSEDGRTVRLVLADIRPVMQQKVKFTLKAADGQAVDQEVFHTIHRVPGK